MKSLGLVGDAASKLVNQNLGTFLIRGARLSRDSVCEVLKAITADSTGSGPDGIEPDTLILN